MAGYTDITNVINGMNGVWNEWDAGEMKGVMEAVIRPYLGEGRLP